MYYKYIILYILVYHCKLFFNLQNLIKLPRAGFTNTKNLINSRRCL